ncbi:MAG: hypothetical protein ACTSUE_10815 [Promethearchaeota archaeon]
MLGFHYTVDSNWVLDATKFASLESQFRKAGVTDLWLMGYFFGKMHSPLKRLEEARGIIEARGFKTGFTAIPVGHPGNSLNPEDGTLDLEIPGSWRYRVDHNGENVYFCADIEETMIHDNVAAVQDAVDAGFTRFFFDDDLRLGEWGPKIQGCFCDKCMVQFSEKLNHAISREDLSRIIMDGRDIKTMNKWMDFNCQKLHHFIEQIVNVDPSLEYGIMVMHMGDRRHGIDLPSLMHSFPNLQVRIGEAHFGDRGFNHPRGRMEEWVGMQLHLGKIPIKQAYSETTVFPPFALSPGNWAMKVYMALALGIRQILLMGGTWCIDKTYWHALEGNQEEFRFLASSRFDLGNVTPKWPIHVAVNEAPRGFLPSLLPLQIGFPALPVHSSENIAMAGARILFIPGNTRLTDEWISVLPRYEQIVIDPLARSANSRAIDNLPAELSESLAFLPSANSITHKVRRLYLRHLAIHLREFIQDAGNIPVILKGGNVGLSWYPPKWLILHNFNNTAQKIVLHTGTKTMEVELPFQKPVVVSL